MPGTMRFFRRRAVRLAGLAVLAAWFAWLLFIFFAWSGNIAGGSDGLGRRPDPGPHPRIVSLAPSITETLLALGLKDHIAGVTSQDPAAADLPGAEIVGLYVRPNLEKIIALRPALVLFDIYPGQADARLTLARAGIRVEAFRVESLADIAGQVRRLGELTGREQPAAELADRLDETIRLVRRAAEGRRPVPVYIEVGHSPLFTAGAGSYLTELVAAAGGANIAGDLPGDYPNISPEFVISRNPEVIFIPGMSGAWRRDIETRPGWSRVAAVRGNRIYSDEGGHPFTVPSPRLVTETLPTMFQLLHGTAPAPGNPVAPTRDERPRA